MSKIYEIPIISRGRIIAPGPDAIEFSGRAGAIFRAPNPRDHIQDLVLTDRTSLRDLHDLPTSAVIGFLAKLGPRLALEHNPYMQEAFSLSLEAGGLTEPVLRGVYAQLPGMFDRAYLEELVEKTIGIEYLDRWVPQGSGARGRFRIRAIGTRSLHITAGNVPVVGAITIIRSALTKSDCLIKLPSNDPLTASAIARTMIEIDAHHPVTKHVAVAYWKGGDEAVESQICRTSRIDKITAWGGMASMKHIQKYLAPGLDLIALNPKLSISIIGKEAMQSTQAMQEAADGIALAAGKLNQTACVNTRVVYVESETDEASLERVIALGKAIHASFQRLPPVISTPALRPDRELESELRALALEEELYWVVGNSVNGGVIVSRVSDRVDFHDKLGNRIVNLVPMPDISKVARWCDDSTQTVGIYPESLRERMRDTLSLAGVQRILPLRAHASTQHEGAELPGMPHDGIEPMRRMVRWVIDELPAAELPTVQAVSC
jgi:Acyl-CoA reductase (LuxC)